MLNIAEKRRLITATPFREVEMLEERKERRQPHFLTYAEEEKISSVAPDHIRVLAILILDTGLRSGREALAQVGGCRFCKTNQFGLDNPRQLRVFGMCRCPAAAERSC